ncbi:MAG TPA: hypothetical protein VN224_11560 [Xanthomonadales bacterium]|nr:hypothetical protein [Xanthomonadales bacterium]
MWTGVQFTGSVPANASQRWFTFNWNPAWNVVWYVMPTSTGTVPEIDWSVAVQRASATAVTYWITVTNHTPGAVAFEARFAVL